MMKLKPIDIRIIGALFLLGGESNFTPIYDRAGVNYNSGYRSLMRLQKGGHISISEAQPGERYHIHKAKLVSPKHLK